MRRLPPYAKRLREVLTTPGTWPIRVFAGSNAWRVASDWACTPCLFLLCPPDANPEGFDWRLLNGTDLLLHQCGHLDGTTLKALVLALMRDGVERVTFIPNDFRPRRYIRSDCEVKYAAA